MCHSIIEAEIMEDDLYMASCVPYISAILPKEQAVLVAEEVTARCKECITVREVDPEEDEEDLCDATFSLAYGTRVLLHQTPFKVKRGRKYGLCGPNGAGKSTLMRAIANKNLQGFPEEINSVYVEHDIQGSHADTPVWQYVFDDEKVRTYDISEQKIREALSVVGFTEEMQNGPVAALSGGWRMKLALSRAMLLNPDMLLLDEPTNHLDQFAVRWLTEYIQNLTTCTCLLVSHDTRFLDAVCTNIIHYENLKLKTYRGNLSDFVRQKPEARAYYELASENTRFSFPEPGRLEGVKSLTKAVLKTTDISFQYPSAPQPQLQNVSIQCSLASRVAVIGVNGAGKSTLVKIMVGELKPDRGEVYRHPNLRIAYVAQHAFHHIDQHFDKTPVEYVMWRYSGGVDKEQVNLETRKMSEEEEKKLQDDAKRNKTFVIERLVGRRMGKREHEFEVEWQGGVRENSYVARSELEAMGYQKMIQECDERVAMEAMAGQRLLITGEIQRHFDGFGLEPQFAQHTPIKALSGGQKVKVVLGASLWNLPHIVILDEPTNFLDRDSLGALAGAIREFKGGIFMISHNAEFYEALCPERWLLNEGRLTVQGSEWMAEVEAARLRREKEAKKKLPVQEEDKYDSLGNKVDKQEKKKASELSRAEKKRLQKLRKEMIKNGQETFEIDELLGVV
jgi:elongation factor 3